MNNMFKEFTKIYSVDKTLRFRLKPVGKTDAHIQRKDLLQEDEKLAEKYKQAKNIIDEYYKQLVDSKLESFSFNRYSIEKFCNIYHNLKNNREYNNELSKKLATIQNKLRKEVSSVFDKEKKNKTGDLIKDVFKWLENNPKTNNIKGIKDPKGIIKDFERWKTYFTGFHENRKNIFTDKDNSGSIGYRLVHENLPRFLDNIDRYKKAIYSGVDFSQVENNLNVNLDKIFTLEGFNQCITQTGIEKYNLIIGGRSYENNTRDQGINENVNLYAQEHPDESKKIRKCQLEQLYKQILSDHNTDSFRLETIQNDSELCELINSADLQDIKREEVEEILNTLKKVDNDRIYIYNKSINDISKHLFGKWDVIKNCLEHYAEKEKFPTPEGKQATKTLSKKREDWITKQSYFSFDDIHSALEKYCQQYDEDLKDGTIKKEQEIAMSKPLFDYFANLSVKKNERTIKIFEEIQNTHKNVLPVLKKYKGINKEKLKSKQNEVEKIKHYLDSLMELLDFLKPLHFQLKKKDKKQAEIYEKDGGFYSKFDELYKKICDIIPIYNKTRNYFTKKPFSAEKYKLNFENQQLGDGWDKSKEKDNACIIFIKDNRYYLGIMDKHDRTLFDEDRINKYKRKNQKTIDKCYKKMIYKQVADPSKDIQNLIEINGNFVRKTKKLDELKKENIPEIYRIKKSESYSTKGPNFKKEDLNIFIDYYKEAAKHYWDWCKFYFYPTKDYETFKDFTDHIKEQAYKITFEYISGDYIHKLVEDGKLYLFEIYSKDFSPNSNGKPNLHTYYWKALFDDDNLKNVVYKLNGNANMFYRKASIQYSDKTWREGHHANDPKKKQQYPIIKDRRYAKNSYFFHVSVTCNFKNGKVFKFNDKVNEFLKANKDVNIIGIDRGERHLAYYTVISKEGKILEQGSFNNPFNSKDYHKLLDQREKDRDKARKSWKTIEKIKDLKEGYLSQVIHKTANLIINHNAIVVFEDLNYGFKKGRFKIEKQVYQKLEKKLIDKLNYLVFKDRCPNEVGGLMNALQLTAPFKSFRELGKQTGLIFYVSPGYTSNVCPVTGFVDLLRPKYKTIKESQGFFKKFKKICFNKNEEYFEFHFNYNGFTKKAEGSKQDWVVYSNGKRLENVKEKNGQWKTQEIDLTKCIKKLFREYSVNLKSEKCLIDQIIQENDSNFFKSLIRFLKLTLQMRNSRIKTDEDWIISPVKNKDGGFFDSRNADDSMPKNADANGAYHIGLKGLMMLEQLRKDKRPYLNNKDWFNFKQDMLPK